MNHCSLLATLPLWFTLTLSLLATNSQALGLGEPQLKSKLGEPLLMEIAVNHAGDLNAEQLLVGAANHNKYAEFDIGYQSIHNALRYKVIERQQQLFIKVTSQRPVKEPYLDVLLQLKWPNGELLKSLTVLLDTP